MNAAVTISEDEGTFRGKGGALFRRSVVPPNPWATIAFVHGYGEHCARYLHFYRWMAERGVACHTFDFRGQGKSAGRRDRKSTRLKLQSHLNLVCRLLLEKKKNTQQRATSQLCTDV